MRGDLRSRRWNNRETVLFHWWVSIQNRRTSGENMEGGRSEYIRCYGVYALATLFRTVPVDEWYNQRSRGTPVLDERGRGRETRPPTIPLICAWRRNREKSLSLPRRVLYFESVLFLDSYVAKFYSFQMTQLTWFLKIRKLETRWSKYIFKKKLQNLLH